MKCVVGIDLGTQSLKAVVCDEAMTVLGASSRPYETRRPSVDHAEQDPAEWEATLAPTIGGALAAAGVVPGDVVALAIAAQLDGCVAVDAAGAPLHRALIWQDRRAVAEAERVARARVHALAGQVADASHLAPKAAWLRAHGVYATRYHEPTSYLVERLTGAVVIDPSLASTTMLHDLRAGAWSPELCAAFAIDEAQLPAIHPATAIAGALTERGAALTGLRRGTPVAVGTGDDFATPLGAGLAAGTIACALGTAEVVGALAGTPVLDTPAARAATDPWAALAEPMVETHAYPSGAWFVEHPGWLSGGAVRWATRLLGLGSDAALDVVAEGAPPGAEGVTFVPWLAGGMTPQWRPRARAALEGLAAGHDRSHVARAVLEGLAFACRDVTARLVALGLPARSVLVLGGGARSATWMQLRADALGLEHRVSSRTDTCAIGAAMIAAVAVGLLPDLAAACALAPPIAATFEPRVSLDDAYARYRARVALLSAAP